MPEEQTTQSISFTINDGTAPINGASVVIGGVSKTTGSAGGCTFDNIEEGTVSVEVSKEGFTTKTEEITVDSEHASFTISLEATNNETTGNETTEETTEESFPSFRKVYKYRGGFDKWVYDQLKGASESINEDTGGE
jgi:hypothetical protein